MPRRKNAYLSDGSDSDASGSGGSEGGHNSQEDEDSKAERALFEHNGRKRRKMGGRSGKESAWEGVFGADEDDSRQGGRGLGARRGGRGGGISGRADWTKAPTFVTTSSAHLTPPVDTQDEEAKVEPENGEDIDDEEGSDDESESESASQPVAASPRIRDTDYDDDAAQLGGMGLGSRVGLGAGKATPNDISVPQEEKPKVGGRGGIGSGSRGRGGIGLAGREAGPSDRSSTPSTEHKGGIGSSDAPPNPIAEHAPAPEQPLAFGRRSATKDAGGASRPQQAFQGLQPRQSTVTPTPLTAKEAAHFRDMNIQSNFGARYLANLGWNAGEGLGVNKDGRAVPIEAGKVLKGEGIQAGVRTEDSKREARRRGEVFSDDEDEQPKRRGRNGTQAGPSRAPAQADQSWKKQKKVKVKVEHKSYEQLLAEAGDAAGAGIGLVLDARGGELKEVQSLSSLSLSSWTPTSDNTQLPELRHNLRLILDVSKADVDALAREGKSVNERRRWALREEEKTRRKIDETSRRISRIEKIQSVISTIHGIVAAQAANSHPALDSFTESFDALLHDFKDEYASLALDEVIVGAIGQVLRHIFSDWQPFDLSSNILLSSLKQWRKAYRLPRSNANDVQALITHGTDSNGVRMVKGERLMTAWESLLWSLWLPKVRSTINNDWNTASPDAAVHLLESWNSILPPFLRDNVLDQLILPKVKRAVEEWDGRLSRSRKTRSLAGIVFPWLPLLGERVEEVLEGAKRRIRSVMRSWQVNDKIPEELSRWKKDIYSSKEWDDLMLRNVVPKLGVCLRKDFSINPRKQDMVPLELWVLPWHTVLRASTFSQLIEVNFFPKWLEILYIWLIQPAYKPDEVVNWFIWWKGRFPDAVLEMKGITHGFNEGLELMDEAMRLGPDAPSKLRKPTYGPLPPSSRSTPKPTPKAKPTNETPIDITFRSLAEDFASQHDLIFLPIGRSHDVSGKPLFKVCKGVDGRGGVMVYVGENAVFAQTEDGSFRAVSLEDMVQRAMA